MGSHIPSLCSSVVSCSPGEWTAGIRGPLALPDGAGSTPPSWHGQRPQLWVWPHHHCVFLAPEEGSYKCIQPSRSKVSVIKTVDQRSPLQTQDLQQELGKSKFLGKAQSGPDGPLGSWLQQLCWRLLQESRGGACSPQGLCGKRATAGMLSYASDLPPIHHLPSPWRREVGSSIFCLKGNTGRKKMEMSRRQSPSRGLCPLRGGAWMGNGCFGALLASSC